MKPHVLHIIQQLSSGGAGQALEALVSAAEASTHEVISLVPAPGGARARFKAKGIPVTEKPSEHELDARLSAADIVQIHFWNTPELYEFLTTEYSGRFLLWLHVEGSTAPHILIPELRTYGYALVHSSSSPFQDHLSPSLTIAGRSPRIFPIRERSMNPDLPITVGIFGTLSSTRMCPEAFQVFAQGRTAGVRLRVVGNGDLIQHWHQQARELNLWDCVEYTGFVEDVVMELERMDVLLHLPRPGCSATVDLALQEAMLAGVVPVLLTGTAVVNLVRHGQDALVGEDLEDCTQHLRTLCLNPGVLEKLRQSGQIRARQDFVAGNCARAFEQLYPQLCQRPRQRCRLNLDLSQSGAERFMASLGAAATNFRISATRAAGWQEADEQIAHSNPALVGAGGGGILHYRGFYPDDPLLRYWAGLVLATSGRRALAAAEFAAAARSGVAGAAERLEQCLREQAGSEAMATQADNL